MSLASQDYRDLAEFRFRLRQFLHFSEMEAREHSLEPQQHQALLAIKGLPREATPTIGELAHRLFLRHHSVVELTDRLEVAGFIRRKQGKDDRRQILIYLTPLGSARLRSLSMSHREELAVKGPELVRALQSVVRVTRRSHTA
jgi:DNA-binding MarR family transcriptional regulator